MVLDGTPETEKKMKMMLHWDVNNGLARRSWARNKGARFQLRRDETNSELKITLPYIADDKIIDDAF